MRTCTIAEDVKDKIANLCPQTFSLYAGYGLNAGECVRFPTGALLREKRDEKGRCILAHYRYADGSELVFRYSSQRETYTLKVNTPAV